MKTFEFKMYDTILLMTKRVTICASSYEEARAAILLNVSAHYRIDDVKEIG